MAGDLSAGTEVRPETSAPSVEPPNRRPWYRRELIWPGMAAVVGGVLIALSFAPVGAWPLAPVGVAVVTLAIHGRSARAGLLLGLLAGLGTFVPLLAWLRVVGADGWLVTALLEATLLAPLGLGLALVTRLPAWPVWSATLWVTQEAWRDRIPFGGFPWGRLAFSQPHTPLTPYAAVAGAPLVTLAVAVVGTALAAAFLALVPRTRAGEWGSSLGSGIGWLALAVGVPLVAYAVPVPTGGQASAAGPSSATVALVQGNVPHPGLHFLGREAEVLNRHVQETERLADLVDTGALPKPDVVIWPENASDLDPYQDAAAATAINDAVQRIGVPTLVGAIVDNAEDPDLVDNSGIVWDPVTGPGARYVKQHPVPFGEYVPMRSILTKFIDRFALVPRDFAHGGHNGVLQLGPVRVGDVICFEIAYDGLVRDTVRAGGRVIVVQTNNATYSGTAESDQQLAISQLRAVEHGRSVLIAATSGISAVVAPDGDILDRSAELEPALLVQEVPLRDSRTMADRLRIWPELLLAGMGLGAVLFVVVRTRRARRQGAAT